MCKHCKKSESLWYDEPKQNCRINEVYIEPDGSLTVETGDSEYNVNLAIKYCPTCGKPLDKKLEDQVQLKLTGSLLDNLIDGLRGIYSKIDDNDRLQINIDFNTGKIKTYVEPRGDYSFESEF